MATYREIQERVRGQAGWLPKTCWIAHVKYDFGLPMRNAPNRAGADRQVPCPSDKRPAIVAALRHFGMIGSN
jgi:hypothetical protein